MITWTNNIVEGSAKKVQRRLRIKLTLYPACCLTRDKGCGNSLVGLVEMVSICSADFKFSIEGLKTMTKQKNKRENTKLKL